LEKIAFSASPFVQSSQATKYRNQIYPLTGFQKLAQLIKRDTAK